ncbi:vWA domain-containing protein [Cuniculiplasma sp. SKW3]|uniref:vWA domain-containing protein n=1 Tax=unclassified Cuniculiplasma TaxID=2619706 RepID=UPI003FD5B062
MFRKKLESSAIPLRYPSEPKCPVVLVLDNSGSMEGEPSMELKKGLKKFLKDLRKDDLARKRVEISVVSFNDDVKQILPFSTVDIVDENALIMEPKGKTSMGEAILYAISKIEERKLEYSKNGIQYFRPWIWLMTDGSPTDMHPEGNEQMKTEWKVVLDKVHEGVKNGKFLFFAVGIDDADMELLGEISVEPPIRMEEQKFSEMFDWLSKSIASTSRSSTSEQIKLDPTDSWGKRVPK